MRPATLATTLFTSGLFLTSHAQLIPFFTNSKPEHAAQRRVDHDTQQQQQQRHNQQPMDNTPGIQLPPPSNSNPASDKSDVVILSDVLGTARQINTFASFCRAIDPVSKRLDTTSLNTTVLAPLNSAISDLPRKPWEDPAEYSALGASAYSGKDGEDRAHRNLRRFTEAHVVPVSPWGEGERVRSLGGEEVWWERRGEEGQRVIMPGGMVVDGVVQRVANGEVWVLKGVLNYASKDREEAR